MVTPSFAVQLGEQRQHARAVLGVEIAGRFVGNDERRFMHERPRNRGTLHLAARHLLRIVTQPMADADTLGQTRRSRIGVAAVIPASRQRQRDVVARS